MDTKHDVHDFLIRLGFDPDASYPVPDDPVDAAIMSVNAFIREHSASDDVASLGTIHITGPSVKGHAAPLKAVGTILSALQDSVDAIGASKQGIFTSSGPLSSDITGKTQLAMVASPLPGSVVIRVAPTLDRMEDLYPKGKEQALFDLEEEIGARPLVDMAFDEFSSLIRDLDSEDPDKAEFLNKLTDYGPRVASKMKDFCDSVDRGNVDIDFEWEEPGRESETSRITHEEARRASVIIHDANIESESTNVIGKIITITMSQKDKLRVETDEGNEETIAIGSISPEDVTCLHTGDRVDIKAVRFIRRRSGGRSHEKLIGVSLERLPDLRERSGGK